MTAEEKPLRREMEVGSGAQAEGWQARSSIITLTSPAIILITMKCYICEGQGSDDNVHIGIFLPHMTIFAKLKLTAKWIFCGSN